MGLQRRRNGKYKYVQIMKLHCLGQYWKGGILLKTGPWILFDQLLVRRAVK